MRFIDLCEKPRSPYDHLLIFGCGPNFVLNRQDDFEAMIKIQGFKFWFRFWLSFCNHCKCTEMQKNDNDWLNSKAWAYINIHEEFLQGTVQQALNYCLNTAIKRLLESQIKPDNNLQMTELSKQQYAQVLQECAHMTFGAALCVVFYKWLAAKDINSSDKYWKIPKDYLLPHYEPKTIERYLFKFWGFRILPLLGFRKHQNLPDWINKLMDPNNNENDKVLRLKSQPSSYDLAIMKIMRDRSEHWRSKIKRVDEGTLNFHSIKHPRKKSISSNLLTSPISESGNSIINKWNNLPWCKTEESCPNENKNKPCSFCGKLEVFQKFNYCALCIKERWSNPRWYCNNTCQREDWFLFHSADHVLPPPRIDK